MISVQKKAALISQNGFIYPDATRHFVVGQSKKCNQCRKLLAGYIDYTNRTFSKVKKIKLFDFSNSLLYQGNERLFSPLCRLRSIAKARTSYCRFLKSENFSAKSRGFFAKKIEPFNFLNDPLYPRTEGHSIAGQSKKCNQCRKLLAGYIVVKGGGLRFFFASLTPTKTCSTLWRSVNGNNQNRNPFCNFQPVLTFLKNQEFFLNGKIFSQSKS